MVKGRVQRKKKKSYCIPFALPENVAPLFPSAVGAGLGKRKNKALSTAASLAAGRSGNFSSTGGGGQQRKRRVLRGREADFANPELLSRVSNRLGRDARITMINRIREFVTRAVGEGKAPKAAMYPPPQAAPPPPRVHVSRQGHRTTISLGERQQKQKGGKKTKKTKTAGKFVTIKRKKAQKKGTKTAASKKKSALSSSKMKTKKR